jgi:hypothetical protein
MMKDIKITLDNDCTIIVEAYNIENDVETPQDLRLVEDLTVYIPCAPYGSYTYTLDDSGRLVLDIDGPQLSVRSYGIEVKGTINGRDWCWRVKKLFEIVKYTEDSNTHFLRLCSYCAVAGINVLPVKTVTFEQLANATLAPSTLYLVVDDGSNVPQSAVPLGACAVYTMDDSDDSDEI